MANQRLRELRRLGTRSSVEVVELAEGMFDRGEVKKLGDELWPFLEQVAFAALDVGRLDLAKMCIGRLDKRFPNSPRVSPLHGMFLEAKGDLAAAKEVYEKELEKAVDPKAQGAMGEANVRIRKRLIALHLQHPSSELGLSTAQGIELLVQHLDTVYTDPEGWLELAEAYSQVGLLPQSLAALEDAMLLQPHNPFYLLRYAETAYTMKDYLLAYKSFLRVIELSGKLSEQSAGGAGRRAAIGAKLCCSHLENTQLAPARMDETDDMLVDQLKGLYDTEWVPLQGKMRVASEGSKRALEGWFKTME